MAQERLDKLLSSTGRWSRREVKELVRQGRVTVNGAVAKIAEEKADPEAADICVNGERLIWRQYTWVMLNKPAGYLSTTEDGRGKTVLDLLPPELQKQGLFPVGRLDKDTTGLLLLTDDGPLGHELLSPKKHVDKVYLAQVEGKVDRVDCYHGSSQDYIRVIDYKTGGKKFDLFEGVQSLHSSFPSRQPSRCHRRPRPPSSPSFRPAPRGESPPTCQEAGTNTHRIQRQFGIGALGLAEVGDENDFRALSRQKLRMTKEHGKDVNGGERLHDSSLVGDRSLSVLGERHIEVNAHEHRLSLRITSAIHALRPCCAFWRRQPRRVCSQFCQLRRVS